jgi:hypothetical protein
VAWYEALRPVTRLWYARELGAGPLVPKPRDAPYIRSGHPRADRALLIGSGPASGWGTLTYQLALVGHLARAMTAATRTPWDADYVGDEPMGIASAREWLGSRPLSGYRVVAVVLGTNDAVRLTRVPEWERHLYTLLDDLVTGLDAGTPIAVAAIVPPSRSSRFAGPFGPFADRHADRLNAATERIVADFPSVTVFPMDAPAGMRPESSRSYAALAKQIGGELVHSLPPEWEPGSSAPAPEHEWEWDATPFVVDLIRNGGSAELQRIADEAQAEFGVAMATVSILDGDRLYYTLNTDRMPQAVPRSLSHCRVVVDGDAPLVVPDSERDARFRDNPLLDVTHATFYAGFPLHAADGQAVGALCLLNGRPKDELSVPIAALERFALQAQAELRRLEIRAREQQVLPRASV